MTGNEEAVGKAIRESGIPREEIFVTTKLGDADHHKVKEAFQTSLDKLGLDYIDLWLMHWPMASVDGMACLFHLLNHYPFNLILGKSVAPEESPTFVETWRDMEAVYKEGWFSL